MAILHWGDLPLAKHQGGFGLHVIVAGGRTTDEHGGAAVPTQRVLQDAGHFAVTVRHVGFLRVREKDTVMVSTAQKKRIKRLRRTVAFP